MHTFKNLTTIHVQCDSKNCITDFIYLKTHELMKYIAGLYFHRFWFSKLLYLFNNKCNSIFMYVCNQFNCYLNLEKGGFLDTLSTCSSLTGRFSSHSPINIIAVASCNYLFRPPRILDCVCIKWLLLPLLLPISSPNNVTV